MAGGGGGAGGPSDGELVAAAQAGDRAALDALLRRHAALVHGLCRRLTGDDHDANDATQEALIAIVRGLDRFDGRSRFSTWAYRVATNACLDELRRRRRRPEPVGGGGEGDEAGGYPGEVLGGAGGASRPGLALDAAAAERLDVDAALARLPADFRAAVVLRDLCGLDYAEIAEVLGVPVGTVRSRIARGRAALVPLLGDRAGNSPPPGERPRKRP